MHLRVVKSNDVVYIDIHGFHTRFYWNSINDNHDKQLDLVTLQWRQRNGVSNHRLFAQPFVQADQRKNQSSASLVFVRGIYRQLWDSPHEGSVTRKMFPFDDVMIIRPWKSHVLTPQLSEPFQLTFFPNTTIPIIKIRRSWGLYW